MSKYVVLCICMLPFLNQAQDSGTLSNGKIIDNTQRNYFRYPLNITPRLNANFGEMRPNHFHMGLDLYTEKKENLPVFSAADGFVSRVKIEVGGFGNAIYIDHYNGLTTLYAHMNEFFPELEDYIKKEQYKSESWAIDIILPKGLFQLKKGDKIGISGNTGASQGPHVHFEIRETKTEKCLNPLLFNFAIPDMIPPDIFSLAFYDKSKSMYEQQPILVPVIKINKVLKANVPMIPFENIGIAFKGSDRMNGFANSNGIYAAKLFEGKKLLTGFTLEKIGYDETRFLNAHIDHPHKIKNGGYLQQLFQMPGDKSNIYEGENRLNGLLLKDGKMHEMLLQVQDVEGNISEIAFSVKSIKTEKQKTNIRYDGPLMKPDQINIFDTDSISLYMPVGSIYDSIHFTIKSRISDQSMSFSKAFIVHDPQVPLHKNYEIQIIPDKVIPYHLRDRLLIRKQTQSNITVKKAKWMMGKYGSEFREFGVLELIADNNPPEFIIPAGGNNFSVISKIVIGVKDDNKIIKNFKATLDGEWLRFVQKGNNFTYVFDEKCLPGEHDLKLFVEDEAGNTAEKTIHFKR